MPPIPYHDEPTPDISGHWYCINLVAERLLSRLCSIDDVLCILEDALRRDLLRSKTQACLDHRLLSPSEWIALQLTLRDLPEGWFVETVYRETGEPLHGNLYVWMPDFSKLWPADLEQLAQTSPVPKSKLEEKLGRPWVIQRRAGEHEAWSEIIPHLKALYDADRLPGDGVARQEVAAWLRTDKRKLSMSRSTIHGGVVWHCRGWWD